MNEYTAIIATLSFIVTIFALYVAYVALRKSTLDALDDDLSKLILFAKANYEQAQDYLNKSKTRQELYIDSIFNKHFETYHKYDSEPKIVGVTWIEKKLFKNELKNKIKLIKEVRKYIFSSRNIIRNAYMEKATTPLISDDVKEMKAALSSIRNYLIKNSKGNKK